MIRTKSKISIPELIGNIDEVEDAIKQYQDKLYSLKDQLRFSLEALGKNHFDRKDPDRPTITIQLPSGNVYRITIAGSQHGLYIEQIPVVKLPETPREP